MKHQEEIIQEYIYFVTEKKRYPTQFEFEQHTDMERLNFKSNFFSMTELRETVWVYFFDKTITAIQKDVDYNNYSVRNKLLTFYHTWLGILGQNEGYIDFTTKKDSRTFLIPKGSSPFKKKFLNHISNLFYEGYQTGELAKRPIFGEQLKSLFWVELMFILHFWLTDKSEQKTNTNGAIEKSLSFMFDVLGKNALDTGFDFAKFMFQNSRLKNIRNLLKKRM